MSRRHRLCNDIEFIDNVLNRSELIFISFNNNITPYTIPFNFVYDKTKSSIYIHTGLEGTKQELIKINNNVGFCSVLYSEVCPEKTTSYYSSICGTGTAHIIENKDEKIHAFNIFANKYNSECKLHNREKDLNRCMIIKINILSLSGKRHHKDIIDSQNKTIM